MLLAGGSLVRSFFTPSFSNIGSSGRSLRKHQRIQSEIFEVFGEWNFLCFAWNNSLSFPGWEFLVCNSCFVFKVMDEADRILNEDFKKELDKLLRAIPRERRTYMYSATMTKKVNVDRFCCDDFCDLESKMNDNFLDKNFSCMILYSVCKIFRLRKFKERLWKTLSNWKCRRNIKLLRNLRNISFSHLRNGR